MAATEIRACPVCGEKYEARVAELKRGWAQTCPEKSCVIANRNKTRKVTDGTQGGRVLAMPSAGLSFADVSLAAIECKGNKTHTAKRLGVSLRGLDATIDRENLHHWFSGRSASRPRNRCVSKSDIEALAQEGYTRSDTAYLLGISPGYLKDLIKLWDLANAFTLRKGVSAAVTQNGYAWQAGRSWATQKGNVVTVNEQRTTSLASK